MDSPGLSAEPTVQRWAPGVASATLALQGDEPCGDAALWLGTADGGLLAIIDGLGHGPDAARAAQAAVHTLQATPEAAGLPLALLLQRLDGALAGLRGAAVGLLQVQGTRLRHAGVGNTRALRLRAGQLTRLPSHNGIVGGGLSGALRCTELDLQAGDGLLLFTDGLEERLQLPLLLPEWRRDPALLCRHLLQHHRQGRDDCGVLVMLAGGG